MWKRFVDPPKREYKALLRKLQLQKKAKFYADEDIEDGAVAVLRECGVNIIGARELGHRGKPDSFQAAFAFKEKRFLLTRNGRHFLNDREFPLNRIHGIVVITAVPGDEVRGSYTDDPPRIVEVSTWAAKTRREQGGEWLSEKMP